MFKVVFILAALMAVSVSFAQGFGGGQPGMRSRPGGMAGGPITMLLMDPKVSDELKLTDDQKSKLADIGKTIQEDMQKAFQSAGGDPEKIRQLTTTAMDVATKSQLDILTADQRKRLQEIYIQDNGPSAILNKDVQKELGLTPEQSKKVATLQDNLMKAMGTMGEKLRSQDLDFQQFQDLIQKNSKIMDKELTSLMTDDQRKKLKEMEGKEFKRDTPGG